MDVNVTRLQMVYGGAGHPDMDVGVEVRGCLSLCLRAVVGALSFCLRACFLASTKAALTA